MYSQISGDNPCLSLSLLQNIAIISPVSQLKNTPMSSYKRTVPVNRKNGWGNCYLDLHLSILYHEVLSGLA